MTADDFKRIAARYTELMHPGEWARMSDAQKAVQLLTVGKALHAVRQGPLPWFLRVIGTMRSCQSTAGRVTVDPGGFETLWLKCDQYHAGKLLSVVLCIGRGT
jgi:hypothetical protein